MLLFIMCIDSSMDVEHFFPQYALKKDGSLRILPPHILDTTDLRKDCSVEERKIIAW